MRGLYAITSAAICADDARLLAAVDAALAGGARLLQYRDKLADPACRERRARALLLRCRAHGVPLIINDDLELALRIGADGVHLGQRDAPLARARDRLGADALLGVSCGDSLELARAAQDRGASYVAFGRFFASRTKPDAPPARLATLRAAHAELRIPCCAIGGITPARAPELIAAGADLIAAVDGVFGAADIRAAVESYVRAFAA
jgi:thiamine-phosphate pyrophosphorylase